MEAANKIIKEVLTEHEVAILVSVSARTLQRARLQGKPIFPVYMVGSAPRYSRSMVLDRICAGTQLEVPLKEVGSTHVCVGRPKRGRPTTNTSHE
jgi:hypothetical protein